MNRKLSDQTPILRHVRLNHRLTDSPIEWTITPGRNSKKGAAPFGTDALATAGLRRREVIENRREMRRKSR